MDQEGTTIERAIILLVGEDGGASSLVEDYDVGFLHQLAGKVRSAIVLTGKQRRAAYRTLSRYEPQLRERGVEFDHIEVPPNDDIEVKRVFGDVIRLTCEGGRIVARTPFKYKDVCKSIPDHRWNAVAKAWTWPETGAAAHAIRGAFKGSRLREDERFAELADEWERQQKAAQAARDDVNLPEVPGTLLPSWEWQRQAFWFTRELPAAMLAMDMGTGKTKVSVDLVMDDQASKVLVLCPVSVRNVWAREFRTHAGERADVLVLSGNIAERVRLAEEFLDRGHDDGRCRVVVTNYEGAFREPFAKWSQSVAWDFVICDESHRIKAATGVMSKYCFRVGQSARRRLALTGTPMGQSPLDVFAQYRFLDPTIFGKSWTAFKSRYALMGGYGGYEVIGYQREEELSERFYSIAYRVGAEVQGLPEPVDDFREAELSSKARKLYTALEKEAYAELDKGGEVTIGNVLVKLLRLQQLTGGAINDDEGTTREVDHAKADLLSDVLQDLGPEEPTVVFCRFRHDLEVVQSIAQALKREYAEISGARKDALDDDARLREGVQVCGVQISSGGVGIDLTRSRRGIYYSLGFSLVDYLQSRKRLARPGQHPTEAVLFLHLLIKESVDEKVYEALKQRKEVVDYMLGMGQ